MLSVTEIQMAAELATQWTNFLQESGILVEDGPTLLQIHEEARRNYPQVDIPAPTEAQCEWFRCIYCCQGQARLELTGELNERTEMYIVKIFSVLPKHANTEELRQLEEKIVSVLCAHGGRDISGGK